ncbi:DUF2586 domain-containing protein [Vallitalea guaymasensis]|uniref:DUF2586 domain-containing protein n=1 Tax=Vallitalea guaymasensis TaxID=1185412 RepID=UPI000DE26114|nr:DUF2586 domain-containing protein [Vallitalea guaymasensis]
MKDVNVNIIDGGLGLNSGEKKAHVKVGVSTAKVHEVVTITNTMSPEAIKEKIGISPLTDAVLDSVMTGANLIYCIPVAGAVAGTSSEINLTGTGQATYAVNGNPNKAYEIIIEITGNGGLNDATYKYSLDNGVTYSTEKTMPTDGNVILTGTGLTIKFTEASTPAESFKIGDTYTFTTKAPSMSNEEVVNAVNTLKNSMLEFEFIHIVGESTEALWSSLATIATDFFNKHFKAIYFICEAVNKTQSQNMQDYIQSLLTARKTINSYRIQVVSARGEIKGIDGTIRNSNCAGLICGLYSKAKVSQSIGEVKSFNLLNYINKLLPEGIGDEDYIDQLDTNGFLTLRQYYGKDGFFVTNARMFADEKSDYQYAEFIRTANQAVRLVRKEALEFMHVGIDPTNPQSSLEVFKALIATPLEKMTKDKEISDFKVIIPEGQDILGSEKLDISIKVVPYGIAREIEIEFALSKPF